MQPVDLPQDQYPWAIFIPRIACFHCGRDQHVAWKEQPEGAVEWFIAEAHRDFCPRKGKTGRKTKIERAAVEEAHSPRDQGKAKAQKGASRAEVARG